MRHHIADMGTLAREVWPAPLVIVSDLHNSGPGGHCNFQRELFEYFLEYVAEIRASLVVAGDINDISEEPHSRAMNEADWLLWRASEARGLPTVKLPGNHDRLERVAGVWDRLDIADLFVWHGDALDPACNRKGLRGNLDVVGSFVWGGIERIGLRRIFNPVRRWLTKTAARRGDTNMVWLQDAEERGKVLYVSGHTHVWELIEWADGHYYANPGSWVEEGKGGAVYVDGTRIELWEVTE